VPAGSTVPAHQKRQAQQTESKHRPKQYQESRNRSGWSIKDLIGEFVFFYGFVLKSGYVGLNLFQVVIELFGLG